MRTLDAVALTDQVRIVLERTLRIPDDGREYPLPPGLGSFPIQETKDGLVTPLHLREALWLGFDAPYWKPHALKVGIGGIDVLTGEPFDPEHLSADPQNYVVIPEQPWLDGINAGDGFIRQFVAVPLGDGLTVEGQLTGEESRGGMQFSLFASKPGRFPDRPPAYDGTTLSCSVLECSDMGLGAGGRMRQEIFEDEHGIDTWQATPIAQAEVLLLEAHAFAARFRVPVPSTPVDVETYAAHGLPWFELYDPTRNGIAASDRLAGVKTVGEGAGEAPDRPVIVKPTVVITDQ